MRLSVCILPCHISTQFNELLVNVEEEKECYECKFIVILKELRKNYNMREVRKICTFI
jgi:hypothetical protein